MFRIAGNCDEELEQVISSQNGWTVDTQAGTPWRIRTAGGKLLRHIETPSDGAQYEVP